MTGSEEGDPRMKSNLCKFDKVRARTVQTESLSVCDVFSSCVTLNQAIVVQKSFLG